MRNEKGFTFIDVMIAMALMGVIAVAILTALATASKAAFLADKRAMAESLARSQMEDVKNQPYDDTIPIQYTILPAPVGYTIDPIAVVQIDKDGDGIPEDEGIQQISVTVRLGTDEVITLTDYKVKR